MEDRLGFESQFGSVMQQFLGSAVSEATRLFERTLRPLRAELVRLRAENADLRSAACTPHHTGAGGHGCPLTGPGKRDVGVQCEKPTMVERCCSPAQFGDRGLLGPITGDRLTERCACASEDGNRQLALLLIKKEPQETDCDEYAPGYFLLKQEGAEPILVRKDPLKNTMEKVEIPSALRGLSRCYQTAREISTSEASGAMSERALSLWSETGTRDNSCRQTGVLTPASSKPGPAPTRGDEFRTPSPHQIFHSVQDSPGVARFGPKLLHPPVSPNKNSAPGPFHSQTVPIPVTSTGEIPRPGPNPSLSQTPKLSLSHAQTQNTTTSGHAPGPRTQLPFSAGQHVGQAPLSDPVPPVHQVTQPVHLSSLSQPCFPLDHVPYAPAFPPVRCAGPPSPIAHPGFGMLPDPLCSSSGALFSAPDNADLLQSLAPLAFPAPLVLTQQETSNAMAPGQAPHLAPLLTQRERQEAASSRRDPCGRGCSVATGGIFEPQTARFRPLGSPVTDPPCPDDRDPVKSSDRSADVSKPVSREQFYTVLSKPGSPFTVPDSAIRMSVVPDLRPDLKRPPEPWDPNPAPADPAAPAPPRAPRRAPEKKTECSECGRILSNPSSLENHMRLHRGERPYTCTQCGKAFPSVRGLNRHVKVHAAEKGYACEVCGRRFVYQFTLTKHRLIHSGDRPFPCKVCGKKFLAKADRATHMRMHTGEKPFFCGQCGKSFKHRVALNMHMQGHRGEKRYVCPHCEKGFVDLGNFKRHKRIHTGEKPFECKVCGKRFTQSAHLKKHVNTQHLAERQDAGGSTGRQCRGPGSGGPVVENSTVTGEQLISLDSGEPPERNSLLDACP